MNTPLDRLPDGTWEKAAHLQWAKRGQDKMNDTKRIDALEKRVELLEKIVRYAIPSDKWPSDIVWIDGTKAIRSVPKYNLDTRSRCARPEERIRNEG